MDRRRRRRTGAAALAATVLTLTFGLAACSGGSGTRSGGGLTGGGFDEASTPDAPASGAMSMPFTRFDGTVGSFADYRGRPLVINFFASWCAPCVKEMPDLEAAHRALGDRVAFVGANVGDQLADGQALAQRAGVTYDLVRDPRQELLRAFGGVAMPTTAFVDSSGRIVKVLSKTFTTEELLKTLNGIN